MKQQYIYINLKAINLDEEMFNFDLKANNIKL